MTLDVRLQVPLWKDSFTKLRHHELIQAQPPQWAWTSCTFCLVSLFISKRKIVEWWPPWKNERWVWGSLMGHWHEVRKVLTYDNLSMYGDERSDNWSVGSDKILFREMRGWILLLLKGRCGVFWKCLAHNLDVIWEEFWLECGWLVVWLLSIVDPFPKECRQTRSKAEIALTQRISLYCLPLELCSWERKIWRHRNGMSPPTKSTLVHVLL